MKKIYFLSFLTFLCLFCKAQVSVTATAGTTGPTNYISLRDAAFAINSGTHQGVISVSITGNTTEGLPSIFLESGTGSALYSSISIRPATGVAATISGDIAGALLDLTGADNITVDGLNTGGSSLVLSNINTTTGASCVRFTDGATNNTIQNCTLLSATPSINSGTIFFGTTVTASGNSNNSILNNRIGDASTGTPANAVYSSGTTGIANTNNTISGNLIYNYFQPAVVTTGILLAANNHQWTIQDNRFYQTAARVFTVGSTHRGIQIAGGSGYTISGNIIGGADETGAGIYDISGQTTRFIGIEMNANVTAPNSLQGNIVRNLQMGTSSGTNAAPGIFCGIYITGGNVNVGTVTGNIIGSGTGNGSIRIIPSTGGSAASGINYNTTGTAEIRNNIVGSIDVVPTGVLSGNLFAVQIGGTASTVNLSNNTLGGSSAHSMSVGVRGTTTGNGVIRGIFSTNTGTLNFNYNLIQNLTHNSSSATAFFRAIECQFGTVTIRGNAINNIAAEGTSTSTATHEGVGILVSTASPDIVIDSNTISNLALTNTGAIGTVLSGIYISSNHTGVQITRNRLFGFSHAATGTSTTTPPVAAGIYLRDVGATGGEIFIANNMVTLGSAQATNTSFIGIWNQVNPNPAVGYTERLYHNSINIEGTAASGAQPSFAFYRGNFLATFTGPTIDMKNNILVNTRTGGTGAHYAIANSYGAAASNSGWPANASDYNVLNANAATVGYWSGNQTFAGWQASSLSDNNSLSGVSVTFVDPATDLHLVAGSNAAVEGKGTPIATVTTDIDNQLRDALLPDLGADELLAVVPVRLEFFRGQKQSNKNLLEWKASSNSASVQFVIERSSDGRNFTAIGDINTTTVTQVFSFYDMSPASVTNYYRLKMMEQGGSISYSAIISLSSEVKNMDISIRPNLVTEGIVNMYIQSDKAVKATIILADATGRVMMNKAMNIPAGAGTYPVSLPAVGKGVYYISLRNGDTVSTQRIVIQ